LESGAAAAQTVLNSDVLPPERKAFLKYKSTEKKYTP
jgi:hypothetical protein